MTRDIAGSLKPLALLAGLVGVVACGIAYAATTVYPGFMTMVTDPSLVFAIPQTPKSAYLAAVIDPTFGTKLTRIVGDPGQTFSTSTGTGTWGTDARHHYSKDQPWSSDGSLIVIQNNGSSSPLILDGNTYAVKYGKCGNYSLGDDRWHPSPQHPHERINVNGSELMWFDVVSCTKTRTWALPFPVDFLGSGEGNPSFDGRFVALADAKRVFVVDMDPQPPFAPYPNQRIGPAYDVSPCGLSGGCSIDWVSISPSGKYVVVNYNPGASPRVLNVDSTTLAVTPRDVTASPPSYVCASGGTTAGGYIYNLGHADMTIDPSDSEDVIVGSEHCSKTGTAITSNGRTIVPGTVIKVRLRDGYVTSLTDDKINNIGEPQAHHISTRNYDRLGWVYVGYYSVSGERFSDEIIAVKLDGSKAVQRFTHRHSAFSGCYRCEPHAVPSRDGRRVIWTSNWAQDCSTCGTTSVVQDYVVDARATTTPDPLPPIPPKNLHLGP